MVKKTTVKTATWFVWLYKKNITLHPCLALYLNAGSELMTLQSSVDDVVFSFHKKKQNEKNNNNEREFINQRDILYILTLNTLVCICLQE